MTDTGNHMNFDEWFYSLPHRTKYSRDHSVYLGAMEAYEAGKQANINQRECYQRGFSAGRNEGLEWAAGIAEASTNHSIEAYWQIAEAIRKAAASDKT